MSEANGRFHLEPAIITQLKSFLRELGYVLDLNNVTRPSAVVRYAKKWFCQHAPRGP
jgi:hypothetical protein